MNLNPILFLAAINLSIILEKAVNSKDIMMFIGPHPFQPFQLIVFF